MGRNWRREMEMSKIDDMGFMIPVEIGIGEFWDGERMKRAAVGLYRDEDGESYGPLTMDQAAKFIKQGVLECLRAS
jgi:hypothetical protein